MRVNNIIDLTDLEGVRNLSDSEIYFLSMILTVLAYHSYDYSLRMTSGKGVSLFRLGEEVHTLPDPPQYEIDDLFYLLTNALPQSMETRDLGGFSKICLFKLEGGLVIALFAYNDEPSEKEICLRLIYGENTPTAAAQLLPEYIRVLEEG